MFLKDLRLFVLATPVCTYFGRNHAAVLVTDLTRIQCFVFHPPAGTMADKIIAWKILGPGDDFAYHKSQALAEFSRGIFTHCPHWYIQVRTADTNLHIIEYSTEGIKLKPGAGNAWPGTVSLRHGKPTGHRTLNG